MCSNKCKKVIQLLVCFIVFFSFSVGIKAKNYIEQGGVTNLYNNCNESNNCVPICIYTCQNNDSNKCYYAKQDNDNEYAYYGHTYVIDEDNSTDGIENLWSFGALESSYIPIFGRAATLYTWTNDRAPSEDGTFYYADLKKMIESGSAEVSSQSYLKEWRTTTEYEKLSKSYVCPKYMGFNSKSSIFFT